MDSRKKVPLSKLKKLGEDSKAVHIGQHNLGNRAFPVPGLWLNSAVLLNSVEEGWEMLTNETKENFAYQRYSNPTVKILEEKFSLIEGADFALATNSGMTACYIVFRTFLNSGDHIVAQHSIYHEISDQIKYDLDNCNVSYTFINEYSTESFAKVIRKETKVIFIESPTNPSMLDVDISALAELCKANNIILAVDNTFLTPLGQKPLELGADLAIYSCTKHINGHGDVLGGIITSNNIELIKKLRFLRENVGLGMDPFGAWLTIRSLRTLPLRLKRHSQSAMEIVKYLKENHSDLKIITTEDGKYNKQNRISYFCGIFSIVFKSRESALLFIKSLKLIRIGTTFGNLESLCYHFGGFARPSRDIGKIGIPKGLVRMSVGLEDPADLIADIAQALNSI